MGSAGPLLAAASAVFAAVAVAGDRHGAPLAGTEVSPTRAGSAATRWDLLRRTGRIPPRETRARRRLQAAGVASLMVDRALGRARLLGLGSGTLAALLGMPPPVCAVLGLLAHRASLLAPARRGLERRREAARELPVLLDLVAAGLAAGLTPPLAVRHAQGAVVGPLAEELGAALHRVELGGRWREELLAVADVLAVPDLRRAVVALESGAVGVADAVAEVAHEVRAAARAAAAERARTAPVKMLFPLVLLVLPAFLLLTVAPVLVATLQSIR